MNTFENIIHVFEKHIAKVLKGSHVSKTNNAIAKSLNYFLSIGGKRIRPLACIISYSLYKPISKEVLHLATALEFFHNFTLIHDDIMDKSLIRRGKKTVHVLFGENAAILSGDALMIAAYEELAKIPNNLLPILLPLFNKTAIEVCAGQQMDMDFETRKSVSLDEYYEMIKLKTSVLLATAFQTGALLAGASSKDATHFYQFGLHLGLAFQIQDDYLDVFGKTSNTGKKIGGDITANKKTFLTVKLMEILSKQSNKKHFKSIFKDSDSQTKVQAMKKLFVEFGIEQVTLQEIEKLTKKALQHVHKISLSDKKKEPLLELMKILDKRTS